MTPPGSSHSFSLITPSTLAELLPQGSSRTSVIDARPRAQYLEGHIPGAIGMAWEDWCAKPPGEAELQLFEPGYWGVLDDAPDEDLADRLTSLGLTNNATIVVYADGARSKGRDGRIAWLLLYLGAARVALLDGSWAGWCRAGGEVATDTRPVARGNFVVERREHRRVQLEGLKELVAAGPRTLLMDTRTTLEFDGVHYRYMPRRGRLPGSYLLPFERLFQRDGRFVDREAYLRLLPSDLATRPLRVAYCEVGVRAATAALLHELHLGEVLPVYDGSIMEWSLDPVLPVVQDSLN